MRTLRLLAITGKTDEFTNKIEVKQRELEPWAAKVSEKKSSIDVAESERKVLATKATALEQSLEQARTDLAGLKENEGSKVGSRNHFSILKETDDSIPIARAIRHLEKGT